MCFCVYVFFFKQTTAYEMRISDWSSDVCSSDLWAGAEVPLTVTEFSILRTLASMPAKVFSRDAIIDRLHGPGFAITDRTIDSHIRNLQTGRASCRESGCQYV